MWQREGQGFARCHRQRGQSLVEYALLLAFVVGLCAVLLLVRPDFREAIGGIYESAATMMGTGQEQGTE